MQKFFSSNKIMKKFLILAISITIFLLNSSSVLALGGTNQIISPVGSSLQGLFETITGYIRPAVLLTFLFIIIYGGYMKLSAAGNAEQEEKSMKIITAGIIGFIIIVIAPVLVDFVAQILNVYSF